MSLGSLSLAILVAVSTPQLVAAQEGCSGVRRVADCPVIQRLGATRRQCALS